MNLFQDIKIPKDKLHQKFKTLKETLSYSGEQEVLNDWVKDFKDRDGNVVQLTKDSEEVVQFIMNQAEQFTG